MNIVKKFLKGILLFSVFMESTNIEGKSAPRKSQPQKGHVKSKGKGSAQKIKVERSKNNLQKISKQGTNDLQQVQAHLNAADVSQRELRDREAMTARMVREAEMAREKLINAYKNKSVKDFLSAPMITYFRELAEKQGYDDIEELFTAFVVTYGEQMSLMNREDLIQSAKESLVPDNMEKLTDAVANNLTKLNDKKVFSEDEVKNLSRVMPHIFSTVVAHIDINNSHKKDAYNKVFHSLMQQHASISELNDKIVYTILINICISLSNIPTNFDIANEDFIRSIQGILVFYMCPAKDKISPEVEAIIDINNRYLFLSLGMAGVSDIKFDKFSGKYSFKKKVAIGLGIAAVAAAIYTLGYFAHENDWTEEGDADEGALKKYGKKILDWTVVGFYQKTRKGGSWIKGKGGSLIDTLASYTPGTATRKHKLNLADLEGMVNAELVDKKYDPQREAITAKAKLIDAEKDETKKKALIKEQKDLQDILNKAAVAAVSDKKEYKDKKKEIDDYKDILDDKATKDRRAAITFKDDDKAPERSWSSYIYGTKEYDDYQDKSAAWRRHERDKAKAAMSAADYLAGDEYKSFEKTSDWSTRWYEGPTLAEQKWLNNEKAKPAAEQNKEKVAEMEKRLAEEEVLKILKKEQEAKAELKEEKMINLYLQKRLADKAKAPKADPKK